jgi:crotonobetainyl-CoA:carnitine CoA-transferase CaiB-like acyl-CoA transferase
MTAALAGVWRALGGSADAISALEEAPRDEPTLPSSFDVGGAASATIGASLLAAIEVWMARGGAPQSARLDAATATRAFRSVELVRVNGQRPGDIWNPISGFYRTEDGRFVQLHTNFPHHLERTLAVLGVAADREAVAGAISRWNGAALEDAITAAGSCCALARTRGEWLAHRQYAAVRALPLLDTVELAPSPPAHLGRANRPLAGIRVLDLTRVLAGPIGTRALAAHGADVLRVSSPHLPEVEGALPDTSIGKRSTFLELHDADDADRLRDLVCNADVFVQSYRPGALDALGFGPEALAELNPRLVYVSLSAYSHVGPWHDRRGYDTLVQTATGMAREEGSAFEMDRPRHVPASPLDNATAYLVAAAAMRALTDRHCSGGARHIRCSLIQTREWFETIDRVDGTHLSRADDDAMVATLPVIESPLGRIAHVPPPGDLSVTPPRWDRGPAIPGSATPSWD